VLAAACEIGCRLMDVRATAIAVATGAGGLELVAATGLPAPMAGALDVWRQVDVREGLTAELYAGNGQVACRDVASRHVSEQTFLGGGGFHGCLLLPLRQHGGAITGVLYLADTEMRDFSVEEIEGARVLASMVESAIENGRVSDRWRGAIEPTRATPGRLAEIEKARALGEMAGGLARELSNIFAIILGKSRLLLARAHDEPLRESLGLLEEAAWRGADVVHRLAGLAAPASEEEVGAVDMAALVEETLASTRRRWKDEPEGRGATIDLVTDLGSAPPVRANASALRDTVVNLVQNAVDAMPRGGRLSVATRPHEGGVELALEDTGEGIPEDARRRAFDPFFTTRSPQRMGLGLTVAHGVVTRYGGRIGISAGPGGGTRVTIWLPGAEMALLPELVAPAFPPPSVDAGVAAPLASPGEGASILVLEHETAIRSLLVDALRQAGHKVETAVDGLSGLGKLESGQWDVVLADFALPERSGLAIARAVRSLHPHTPVVLITGWGHLLDPERLREHGVDLMLLKPFRVGRALSVVGDALRLRASS
jgi:signal transduction histidine kinase